MLQAIETKYYPHSGRIKAQAPRGSVWVDIGGKSDEEAAKDACRALLAKFAQEDQVKHGTTLWSQDDWHGGCLGAGHYVFVCLFGDHSKA